MNGARRDQSGYSLLLELLLGLGLVVVVLLAIFQVFPVGDRSVGLADRTTQANMIARREMNSILEKRFEEVESYSGEETVTGHTQRRGQSLSTTFMYDVKVAPASEANVKDIVVTVRWRSGAADQARDGYVQLESSKGTLW